MSVLEEELYMPVKKYFEKKGFTVKGEVMDCDIVCVSNNIVLIVELKRNFNLKLVYQAIERQKITDYVYVAVPRPKNFQKTEVKNMIGLLKKLNIGLITVNFGEKRNFVQIILDPAVPEKTTKQINFKQQDVLREFNERKCDFNIGGKNKTKILTAYREKSIEIACFLEILGQSSGAELKKTGCDKNSTSIMYNNFYGWFDKVSKGIYKLSEKWQNYLGKNEFFEIIEFYRKEAKECLKSQEMKNVGAEAEKNIKCATKEKTKKI